jgi:hypothetical protein
MTKSDASRARKAAYSLKLWCSQWPPCGVPSSRYPTTGRLAPSARMSLFRFFSQKWGRESGTTAMARR